MYRILIYCTQYNIPTKRCIVQHIPTAEVGRDGEEQTGGNGKFPPQIYNWWGRESIILSPLIYIYIYLSSDLIPM